MDARLVAKYLTALKEKSGLEATEFDKIGNMYKNYEEITKEFIVSE